MSKQKIAVVVLAAGMGSRMKSKMPKVMHPIAGQPMVLHLLESIGQLSPEKVVVVAGPEMASLEAAVAPHPVVIQTERLGTGHAVLTTRDELEGFDGDVLVVYGDTPLLQAETLEKMLKLRRSLLNPAAVVLGFEPMDPGSYGRLLLGEDGGLDRIVEFNDADEAERSIELCNSGVMVIEGASLFTLLDNITNDNAKEEYYLTDVVALAKAAGRACAVVEGDEEEMLGVNSRVELAAAEMLVQDELRTSAMENGATLTDPSSVYFAYDTVLGRDVVVGPNVVFGPGVTVGDNVTINAFSHIEGATVADGASVGPFARLRPGAEISDGARIGNFVEVKNARVETGAKVNHLSYIGDARVGAGANVGAGTITCNYDGYFKDHTDIGAGAFIGSNTALVAPVKIGDGAIVGAGSVVSKDVAADALAVTRAPQKELAGWAAKFRTKRAAEKAAKKKS